MVSKTIKYVDYNGVEKTGTYWFNMSRADLFSLELEGDEGWTDRVKRLIAEQNTREVVKIIEKFMASLSTVLSRLLKRKSMQSMLMPNSKRPRLLGTW